MLDRIHTHTTNNIQNRMHGQRNPPKRESQEWIEHKNPSNAAPDTESLLQSNSKNRQRTLGAQTGDGSSLSQLHDLAVALQTIPLGYLIGIFLCLSLPPDGIGGYGIYVASKFHQDGNQQCKADAVWLFGMGIVNIAIPIFLFVGVLSIRSSCLSLGKIMMVVSGLACCFAISWMIYCVALFFTLPICNQMEAHQFGKVLAIVFTIELSCVGLSCVCALVGVIIMCCRACAEGGSGGSGSGDGYYGGGGDSI